MCLPLLTCGSKSLSKEIMKYLVLLVIFTIAQYQGVTGLPQRYYGYVTRGCVTEKVSKEFQEHTKGETLLKRNFPPLFRLITIPRESGGKTIKEIQDLSEGFNNITHRFGNLLKEHFDRIIKKIETIVDDIKGIFNKTNKDQLPHQNITLNNTTEINASQTTPTLNESLSNQQSTPVKIDDTEEKIDNKDSLAPENNDTQDVSLTVSTLDESTVDQQSSVKNDDNEDKSEVLSVTPDNTASSNETQKNAS